MRVFGIHHLPGQGPVLLVSNAVTPDEQVQVEWASDRQVNAVSTMKTEIASAIKYLDSGAVIAISIKRNPAEAETFLHELKDSLQSRDAPLVPVHVSHPDVKFGAPLPLGSTLESIQNALDQAAKEVEE
jgi:hypothetical protein